MMKLNVFSFLTSIFLAVFSLEIQIALSRPPSSSPECRPGEFYDGNVFDFHPCSLCFTKEGEMFETQCKLCNCTAIQTTSNRIPTRLPTRKTTSPSNQTYQGSTLTSIPQIPPATSVPSINNVTYRRHESDFSLTNPFVFGALITIILLVFMLALFLVCKIGHQKNSTSVRRYVQGCYRCTTTKSTECSEGNNRSSLGESSYTTISQSSDVNHVTGHDGSANPSHKDPRCSLGEDLESASNNNDVRTTIV